MSLPMRLLIQFCMAVMPFISAQSVVFGDTGHKEAGETIIAPQIGLSDDSSPLKIIAETPLRPQLNPSRLSLLRECTFCSAEHREWLDDTIDVYHMAEVCGMDYLLLRFDRIYRDGDRSIKAAFFFSCRESGVLLDSVLIEVEDRDNSKRLKYINYDKPRLTGLGLPAFFGERSERNRSLIVNAAKMATTFRSAARIGKQEAIIASLDGIIYLVADGAVKVRRDGYFPMPSAITDAMPSFQLAYDATRPVSCEDCDEANDPEIVEATIEYDEFNRVMVEAEAKSKTGLQCMEFFTDTFRYSTVLFGQTNYRTRRILQLDTSQRFLNIVVIDLNGNRSTVRRRIFDKARKDGIARRRHEAKEHRERAWADHNIGNKVLWTLSHLGVGPANDSRISFDPVHGLLDRAMKVSAEHEKNHNPPVHDLSEITMTTVAKLCVNPPKIPFHIASPIRLPHATATRGADNRFSLAIRLEGSDRAGWPGALAGRIVIHFSRKRVEPAISFAPAQNPPELRLPIQAFLSYDSTRMTNGIFAVDGIPGALRCAGEVSFRTIYLGNKAKLDDSLTYLLCVNYRFRKNGDSLNFKLPGNRHSWGMCSISGSPLQLKFDMQRMEGALPADAGQLCEYRLTGRSGEIVDFVDIFVFNNSGKCLGATTVRCPV
jgi:hypothetical protein